MTMKHYISLIEDTICALATQRGGAIGVIRVSGKKAIEIVEECFEGVKGKKNLKTAKGQSLHFGFIKKNEEIIDEVLLSLFKAPNSYTGEDIVEISCHGSEYILQTILDLLVEKGCRIAKPGEFTQRAFCNGKMDLSQAEAVADLIASKTKAMHKMAFNQMRGGYSKQLKELRDKLLHLTSLLELELDFSDHEDLEFADRTELLHLVKSIQNVEKKLIDSFRVGNAFKNGVSTVIIGETNAGKSTLLNALVGEEKAIVSDIHGTTRDIIEDVVTIEQIDFRFIDTAGIRNTTDVIESIGIKRSLKKIDEASVLIWVIDSSDEKKQTTILQEKIIQANKPLLIVLNKVDLIEENRILELKNKYEKITPYVVCIVAQENKNLTELKAKLIALTQLPEQLNNEDIIVSNARHIEALKKSFQALIEVENALTMNVSGELIALDLHIAIQQLSEIIGNISSQDTLNNIFKNFCIGK